MKIKKISKLKVNCYDFKVKWDKNVYGASFSYTDKLIVIGTKDNTPQEILMLLCHELMEITAIAISVRFHRPDCDSDYLFAYDHRQHTTLMDMFSGLLYQFIGE